MGGVHLVSPDVDGSKASSPLARPMLRRRAGSGGVIATHFTTPGYTWDRADGSNGHSYCACACASGSTRFSPGGAGASGCVDMVMTHVENLTKAQNAEKRTAH